MLELQDKLIVALDVGSLPEVKHLVDILYPKVKFFKVGSQLFTACGQEAVRIVGEKGAKVFLDLKFYDIPNTVSQAVISGTGLSCVIQEAAATGAKDTLSFPVFMMTAHIKGGRKMLKEAVKGVTEKSAELKIIKPFIVGVTRLTSEENNENTRQEVLEAARLAKDSGLDGVVCAVSEAAMIKKEFGRDFLIVTPGIRPKGASVDDQRRIATAKEAIEAGADYIVVGRPIIKAEDPLKAIDSLMV